MTSYYIGYQIPYHFSTSSEYILVGTAGDFVYINDEGALASAGEYINVRDGYLTIGGALRIVELAENPDTPIDGYGYLYADSHGILHFKNDNGVDISLSGDGYMDAHVLDTDNPHETSISNIGAGTLAELNSALSDATLDDSGDPRDPNSHADTHILDGSDELDGYNIAIDYTPTNYTTPVNGIIGEHIAAIDAALVEAAAAPVDSVFGRTGAITAATDDYAASQIDNDSAVTGEQVSDALEYLDGYVSSVADDMAGISTMAVSGDLSGTLPNPTVTDLTIADEEQGSILYFNGTNWVQFPPGADGYVLTTDGSGTLSWSEGGGSGTQDLESVLSTGNTTGNNYIIIENNRGLIGSSVTPSNITLVASNYDINHTGGQIYINKGDVGAGGNIQLQAGFSNYGAQGERGGNISINSGDAINTGGHMYIAAGNSNGGGGNPGGSVQISSGHSHSNIGGNLTISSGNGYVRGGLLTIQAGDNSTITGEANDGDGGNLVLLGGNSTQETGGNVQISAGDGGAAAGVGGDILISSGSGDTIGTISFKIGGTSSPQHDALTIENDKTATFYGDGYFYGDLTWRGSGTPFTIQTVTEGVPVELAMTADLPPTPSDGDVSCVGFVIECVIARTGDTAPECHTVTYWASYVFTYSSSAWTCNRSETSFLGQSWALGAPGGYPQGGSFRGNYGGLPQARTTAPFGFTTEDAAYGFYIVKGTYRQVSRIDL